MIAKDILKNMTLCPGTRTAMLTFKCLMLAYVYFFIFSPGQVLGSNSPFVAKYYLDKTSRLSHTDVLKIDDSQWQTGDFNSLSFAPSAGKLWVQLSKTSFPLPPFTALQLDYPSIEKAEIFFLLKDDLINRQESGLSIPFSHRPVKDYSPTFQIPLDRQWSHALLSVETRAPLKAPVQFKNPLEVEKHFYISGIVSALYIGLMIGIATLCIVLAESIGITVQIAYGLHTIVSCFAISMYHYYPISVIATHLPSTWAAHTIMFLSEAYCLSLIFIFYVVCRKRIPILNSHHFWIITGTWLGALGVASLFTLNSFIIIAIYASVLLSILFIISMILIYYRRVSFIRQFVIAQGCVIAGFILFIFQSAGFIPSNFFTLYSLKIGTLIEVAVLTYGLKNRVKKVSYERITALKQKIREEEARLAAEVSHSRRLAILVQLGKKLRTENALEEVYATVRTTIKEALGKDLPESFLKIQPEEISQDPQDITFLKSVEEILLTTINAIEFQHELSKKETEYLTERLEFAKEKLSIVAHISDRLNSPLMALMIIIEAFRLEMEKSEGSTEEDVVRHIHKVWIESAKHIDGCTRKLKILSDELSALRESLSEIEPTKILTRHIL